MTRYYLDTSIAVHALRGTPAAERWFDQVTRQPDDNFVSSRLLQAELTRVLRRDQLPVVDRELILRHVDTVSLTESVLVTAEAITEHVKTLDAIHLASALAVGDVVVASHDSNVLAIATTLGLTTHDPLAGSRGGQ